MSTATYDLQQFGQHAAWQRTPADERINTATHGFGLVLALIGALVMGWSVWHTGDAWRIAGCGIFLASLVAVYAASTLSHSSTNVRWKSFFRRLDQGFIYFLIVATYTPFGLVYLRTSAGWSLLIVLWAAAFIGFFSKVFLSHRVHEISMWTYVALGWLPWVTAPVLKGTVSFATGWWMVAGGLCYLIGTLFLFYDARVRHFHAVWHMLVIAGSGCHFLGILDAVARAGN